MLLQAYHVGLARFQVKSEIFDVFYFGSAGRTGYDAKQNGVKTKYNCHNNFSLRLWFYRIFPQFRKLWGDFLKRRPHQRTLRIFPATIDATEFVRGHGNANETFCRTDNNSHALPFDAKQNGAFQKATPGVRW